MIADPGNQGQVIDLYRQNSLDSLQFRQRKPSEKMSLRIGNQQRKVNMRRKIVSSQDAKWALIDLAVHILLHAPARCSGGIHDQLGDGSFCARQWVETLWETDRIVVKTWLWNLCDTHGGDAHMMNRVQGALSATDCFFEIMDWANFDPHTRQLTAGMSRYA